MTAHAPSWKDIINTGIRHCHEIGQKTLAPSDEGAVTEGD